MADNLEKYRQKRDFKMTAEPEGIVKKTTGNRYLIQKHAATRLHYDFRLELDGTLKSWAVTKGPSLDPADRRLAVEVEDHPVSYGTFEGTIPKGQYGGGTVMLWDEGTWEPVGDPRESLKKGDFKFRLNGKRLQGEWVLVRMKPRPQDRGRNNWLLIKHHDGYVREGDHDQFLIDNDTSIVSGRTMDEIAAGEGGGKVWKSNRAEPAATRKKTAQPTLKFIEPELATLADAIPTGKNWLHEVKFDGYRTLAYIEDGDVRMLTRTGLDWTPKFRALADRLETLGVKSAIIDGEVVATNPEGRSSFKTLQDTLSSGKSADLQYYVFDLLYLDGEDLRGLPLLERKARLAEILKGPDFAGRINFSDHFFEADKGFLNKICDMEMEGIICKRADAPYASGRAKSWLKVKCHKRQEFVIGGFSEPTHAERGIGALLLGYYEEEKFIYAGKCGTGFDRDSSVAVRKKLDAIEVDKSRYDVKLPADARRGAHYVEPKIVCEIEFTEWTPDGRLRHPSFQGLREDKPAAEVGRDRELHVTKKMADAEPPPVEAEPVEPPKLKKGDAEVSGIRISHPDRVIFPALGITKLQLAEYYDSIADRMLPYIIDRPISMLRCPEGLSDTCFFQRHIGKGEMKHIYDTGVKVKGRDEDYIMIKDHAGLITMIQWGVIEIHPWGAMAAAPDKPNQIIFDLDPDPETPWENVIEGVREVKTRMEEFGLKVFLKTTGGKGLHVVVPLTPKHTWATIKPFTRAIADSMAHDHPDRYIATASKAARKGKIFVDYLRNDLTSTAVAPFAVRAREGAGVAAPLFWDELSVKLKPSDYNIGTIAERLAQLKSDPWANFLTTEQTISEDILTALRINIHI